MVSRYAKRVSGGKLCEFCLFVGPSVPRSVERRLEQTFITQASCAAVDRKLLVMDGNNDLSREPKRLAHLASSANALW
jgi:hypothetical protein